MTIGVRARVIAAVCGALLDAWALIQPIECLGCGEPDRAICAECRAELADVVPMRVRCDIDPGAPVIAAADYGGVVRAALLALKDGGRTDAARYLARHVRGALAAVLGPDAPSVEVAWVPSRPAALRRRGFDPVLELALGARVPVSRVLAARWAGRAQKSLDRAARIAATDRFRARGRLEGRRFVLVDDVATTGATLAACAAAIRRAGGHVVGVAVVCAPERASRAIEPAGAIRPRAHG